jgi:membrane protease YdiL (CAAX protease family)
MTAAIRQHPVFSFIIIAFVWTWPLAALINQSMVFPLLALFGPGVAAITVLYASHGRAGLLQLGSRFQVSRRLASWAIVASLLPIILLVPVWLLHTWFWGPIEFKLHALSFLSFAVAVLIVGEEIGWRGFLLPHLLESYSSLTSSVIVGMIWALWHLPNFLLPSYPHYGLSFSVFLVTATAFSILFTWLYVRTAGSLLIAVIFHAALNLFSPGGMERSRQYWLQALVYGVVALIAATVMRRARIWRTSSTTAN